jgi:hypothetical protein
MKLAGFNASFVALSDHGVFDWKSCSCRFSSSGLDALPLEVLEMVVNHLVLRDMKSLRLDNEAYLLRLTPQVFCHSPVPFHPKNLQALHSITTHSHILHLIHSLTYDIRMIAQFTEEAVCQSVKARYVDAIN